MIILKYIFLYFIILVGSIFIADKLKDKAQNTIIVELMISMLGLYIFGILNILNIGIYLITLSNLVLGIITIIRYIKNKNIKQLRQMICTPGILFFTVIFFIFIIVTLNRTAIHWDQYSYWSYAAKDMYYSGKLNIQNDIGTQYPPVPTVLQVYFMKILGTYSQGIEIFTMWILSFSLLIPFFNKTNNKKICNIAISIIILCIPAIFSMLIFYESTYPDVLLGLFIGYISKMYFLEKNEKTKNFIIPLSFFIITLTKPTGFVIAGIIAITFLIYEIIKNKMNVIKLVKLKEIQKIIIYILIIILTCMSFNMYIKFVTNSNNKNIVDKNNDSIVKYITNSIITTIFGTTQNDYNAAQSNGNLLYKLQKTTEITTPIYISALGVICIYIITSLYIYKYSKDDKNISKKDVKNIYISIFIGLILYIMFLQVAYITQFSAKEMINHDGFERYIGTYLVGILYFTIYVILEKFEDKNLKNNFSYVLLAVILFTITPIYQIANATVTSGIYNISNQSYLSKSYENAEYINKNIEPNAKVLGVCQKTDVERLENLIIRYYIYPINYKVMDKIDQSKGSMYDIIKNYNYIYIVYSDSYLEYTTKQYLDEGETIKENTLYKVNTENQTIKLEKINK